MKKKLNIGITITLILIFSIFLVGLIKINNHDKFNTNLLKAEVVNSSEANLKINCDKSSVNIGDNVVCNIVGYLNNTITGVSGEITVSEGLTIMSIEGDSNFEGTKNITTINYNTLAGNFDVATVTLKATQTGVNNISLTKITKSNGEVIPVSIGNENHQDIEVSEPSFEIQVIASTRSAQKSAVSSAAIKSSNANLTQVEISSKSSDGGTSIVTLSGLEDRSSTDIEVSNPYKNGETKVIITATAYDTKSTVSGQIGEQPLNTGKNVYEVTVTAEDGTKKVYNIITTKDATTSDIDNNDNSSDKDSYNYKFGEKVNVKLNDNLTKMFYVISSNDENIWLLSDEIIDGKYTFEEATSKAIELKELWSNTIEVFIPYAELIVNKPPTNGLKFSEPVFLLNGFKYWTFEAGTNENEHFSISTISSNEGEEVITSNTEKLYFRPAILIKREYVSKIENKSACNGVLSSSKYEIDNDKKEINKVGKDATVEEIRNNLEADCGNIMVSEETVTLTYNGNIKSYKINRYWAPQTGQTIIKYGLIITGLVIIIGLLMYLLRKSKL